MAWITLTTTQVREQLTDEEITAAEGAGEDDGIDNAKLDGILRKTINQVRGYVGACERNLPLGDAGDIPDECENAAVVLVRHSLAASVPGYDDAQGNDRRDEWREALKFLEKVARCEIAIVPVGGSATTPATGSIASAGSAVNDWSM